jgi:CheY-like chemotaxis protein
MATVATGQSRAPVPGPGQGVGAAEDAARGNGFAVSRLVRTPPGNPQPPHRSALDEAMKTGMDGYASKPIGIERLAGALERSLAERSAG